jgi:SAM-dependent methyltransferase
VTESIVHDTKSAAGIIRLGNAFCDAQALLTAAQLDLFTVLADHGPASLERVRELLGLHGRGLRDFLRLLVALGLLEHADGRYRNAPNAARYLVGEQQPSVAGFLRGLGSNLYPVWAGLTETLRTGAPRSTGERFEDMLNDPDALLRYARMMDGLIQVVGPLLIKAAEFHDARTVLDVGGCRGNLISQLLTAHPHLHGIVFDLPQMRPLFDSYTAEHGVADRARFQAGDFFADPLPAADVIVLGHVLHNWRAEAREHLVRAAFQALNPGGTLLVHDRMLDDEQSNVDNLLASLMMALVTEEGAEYPIAELRDLAHATGFDSVRHQQLDDNETLVSCHKPA